VKNGIIRHNHSQSFMRKISLFPWVPQITIAMALQIFAVLPLAADVSNKAQPAGPRYVVTNGFVDDQPLFVT
jgi:hypothetical protein